MRLLLYTSFMSICLLQACRADMLSIPSCLMKCNQGFCEVVSGLGPRCVCPAGYSGFNCETKCSEFCKNKGMCYSETSPSESISSNCTCSTKCESLVNVCDGRCYNGGTCYTTKLNQPQCICKPGFTGTRCQDCSNLVCKNDGICMRNGNNTGICHCSVGYHGQNCELSDCTNYCLNGGTCTLNPTGPINMQQPNCTCPPFYSGRRCDINLCLELNAPAGCSTTYKCGCLNNGTCEERSGSKICKCTDFWGGDKCQRYMGHSNACINRCQNNGICRVNNARDFPRCICANGWTGELCEQDIKCQFYCHNGGTCFIRDGAPQCQCTSDYKGTNCHQHKDEKDPYIKKSGGSSVVLSALLAFGVSIAVIAFFGAIYYILRRKHKFIQIRLLENDFNNPMFQDREME